MDQKEGRSQMGMRMSSTRVDTIMGAVAARDYPMILGSVLFVAMLVVLVNLAVDLLYGVLDPRVRYE